MKILRRFFGQTWIWNSVLCLIGAACFADTFWHFAGIVCFCEALLMSIEEFWPQRIENDSAQ